MYKYATNDPTGLYCILKSNEYGTMTYVPNDSANSDWQEYQAWLAADPENQPLPADE